MEEANRKLIHNWLGILLNEATINKIPPNESVLVTVQQKYRTNVKDSGNNENMKHSNHGRGDSIRARADASREDPCGVPWRT